ncbi:pentatricopeptide repeat-containing protein At4g02750-like [Selaginella moellendorffii]|uniref:pentatricopeptide repeat-containing protein At4g02750-like n=1 Tax=Selaginella moellendorffii TaxID=88036 RepID=UPI000D1CD796|nr:pentatricopeptide repeat-containing protein At4g02750-like [Selaginella moellendorffii]|eukprot:XP_024538383.1 pentatricopeptide repeat-containing protein At4g02750-like [Selaginella moellendorffii]
MFGACGGLDEARSLFARIRPRNVFSYNIMLGALAQNGHLYGARNLFDLMPGRTDVSWTAMIYSYASTGEVSLAKEIFDEIPEKDRISWNAMITAYAQAGYCYEDLEMLRNMDLEGLQLDNITFISSINCCSTVGCQVTGRQLHDDVVDLGLMAHVSVATACVSMYGKFGRVEKATEIFDKMPQKNVVSWTTMVAAYAQNGHLEEAREIFERAPQRNDVTWNAMLAAFVQGGRIYEAGAMFDFMPMQNASTWNTLIAAFGQSGDLEEATDLFHRMPLPNLISWNTIIFANAQNGRGENSIKLLMRMDVEGLRPNRVTLLAVLTSETPIWEEWSSQLSRKWSLHTKLRLLPHYPLRDFIAARDESSPRDDPREWIPLRRERRHWACKRLREMWQHIRGYHDLSWHAHKAWSAMITAYAQNGHNMSALTCFGLMQQQGFIPDAVTFVAAISACSHAGLVETARGYFLSMQVDFMIDPICEHFGCLIDLLGRSGRLEAAQELIKCMPFLPDSSSWTALLNACCIHGDLTRASSIGDLIIDMPGCDEAGPYVLLSNVYSVLGERGKAARVQEILSRKISKGLTIVDIPRIS